MIDRREFLVKAGAAGAIGALALARGGLPFGGLWAEAPDRKTQDTTAADIVAVKGGNQASRLERALDELGGIGAFVKAGQSVVVKPNIGWAQAPAVAANTSPELVKRLVELCLQAGASKVTVFDHSCDNGAASYRASRIEKYAKDGGAAVVPGDQRARYRAIKVPGALVLKEFEVHEALLDADVFVNVPVLKDHSGAGMTCAMKNFMGVVWDRMIFHQRDLDQCIADSCLIRQPDLNVVDADRVMLSGGPRGHAGSQYGEQKMLIASTDIVAVDVVSARTLGHQAPEFGYISRGEIHRLGVADLSKHAVKRVSL